MANLSHLLERDLDHVLAHSGGAWESLRSARIFLTGGTGFFGKWLLASSMHAHRKLGLESQVVVLTRDVRAFREAHPEYADLEPALSFHQGDVRTFAFPPGAFTHVIHAATAASAKLNEGEPLLMVDTILEGTRRTLEFARAAGAENFLFTSSGAVYGRQALDVDRAPETELRGPDPLAPGSAYGEAKRMAEHICATYQRQCGIQVKIARCFAFVGPHLPLDAHFAIGNFIRDGLKGGPIRVRGDGTPLRSYLYAADLAVWLWTLLTQGPSLRPYNVGSDASISMRELAELLGGVFRVPVEIIGKAEGNLPPERYVPAVSRAECELGLRPWINLETAIDRTIHFHAAHAGSTRAASKARRGEQT